MFSLLNKMATALDWFSSTIDKSCHDGHSFLPHFLGALCMPDPLLHKDKNKVTRSAAVEAEDLSHINDTNIL